LKYKKFVAWFIVFFGYVAFLYLFSTPVETLLSGTITKGASGGSVVAPGISNVVNVQIIRAPRPYIFGLIHLPAYVLGINIDWLNQLIIDYIMFPLLIIFIIWEVIMYFVSGKVRIVDEKGRTIGIVNLNQLEEMKKMGMIKEEQEIIETRPEFQKPLVNNSKKSGGGKLNLKSLLKSLGFGFLLAIPVWIFFDSAGVAVMILIAYIEYKLKKLEKKVFK
jgi:hypothetical protein